MRTAPQRIVAEEYLGSLMALGTIPVGAPGLALENMYFKEFLTGVADTGTYGKMSPEKIIALNPDLIISGNADNYATLSKIAPTVIVPYGDLKNAHEELTYFGKLLGKEQEAAAWLADYDKRIADAKSRVDAAIPAGATFSIFEHADKSTWVYGDNFGRGGQPVYQALGRKPPAEVAADIMEKQWAELSAETLGNYAGDYLVITDNTLTAEDFQADPIWGSLPAVKNGNIYVWKEERSWYYDPIAVLAQTEELADWLTSIQQ
ncbi:ABC transporter substrate-binding protein [Paenibacillus sp. FSL K6-1096]|uniref:ABC transporter substrate-binding protein n=1 Tax=Paenibacillus sp. FSL K6-1096 TaxID=2921460 RepID=UPI0030EDAB01